MPEPNWINSIIRSAKEVSGESPLETTLCENLIARCYSGSGFQAADIGLRLAAAFDLFVASQYYGALSHSGWFYCPSERPRLFFHYTNCCPRCVLSRQFIFNQSNKPTSGKIGTATARLLLLFLQSLFKKFGLDEVVMKGVEPVDAVILNRKTKKAFFAEIKASPLLTPSISCLSEELTCEDNGELRPQGHFSATNTGLYGGELEIVVPKPTENGQWECKFFSLGRRDSAQDREWALRGLQRLMSETPSFFESYFRYWKQSILAYHPKKTDDIYWLTNACGTPAPIPSAWPRRARGEGFESISDSKTSVGIDRTDDIKKGIYQVLKLGAEGKPSSSEWTYRVGLISNIHAARHFDEYLAALQDIVWTIDTTKQAKKISDLPIDTELFNLFDGIVALTNTLARDEWVAKMFTTFLR